jgi:hypothetical protein
VYYDGPEGTSLPILRACDARPSKRLAGSTFVSSLSVRV